mmetsp:Transcript_20231/g.56101  ORF Transcript_20231/g.56101 Transcript_20231/m.56101 type:complete len:228 (-) Transcript_20231:335-1018(-)
MILRTPDQLARRDVVQEWVLTFRVAVALLLESPLVRGLAAENLQLAVAGIPVIDSRVHALHNTSQGDLVVSLPEEAVAHCHEQLRRAAVLAGAREGQPAAPEAGLAPMRVVGDAAFSLPLPRDGRVAGYSKLRDKVARHAEESDPRREEPVVDQLQETFGAVRSPWGEDCYCHRAFRGVALDEPRRQHEFVWAVTQGIQPLRGWSPRRLLDPLVIANRQIARRCRRA